MKPSPLTLGKRWSWRRFWRLRCLFYQLGWLKHPHHRPAALSGSAGTRSLKRAAALFGPHGEAGARRHLAEHYGDAGVPLPWEER